MAVDLGKQVGPLPLGAWFIVVGSGLGLAYYGYRNQDSKPVVVDDVSGDPGVGDGTTGGWIQTGPPAPTTTGPAPAITTNEEWGVQAINWLIGQGYPASVSDSAIRKYLAGNEPKPSVQEYTLQGIALRRFGSPPQPLPPGVNDPPSSTPPPVGTKPPPVTKPPPKPAPSTKPKYRYYTVKGWPAKGSTLWGISEIYYGKGSDYGRIYNANRSGKRRADGKMGMISNPKLIRPGWVLLIP
jgi:hypothetical protein